MTPEEKWKRVEELFHEAVALPSEVQRSFLEEKCQHQPEILSEVWSLLANHSLGDKLIAGVDDAGAIAETLLKTPRLPVGKIIGQYEIISVLGRGGMGEVYLARDMRLSRKVAIKVLPRLYSDDAKLLHRLESEALATSHLNHPNILTIHAIGHDEGVHYIVSEFVDGKSLRDLIGTISVSQAINYLLQVGNALRASHTAGIIHRDIKPENIMVRNDGYVKVLDFGLAKSLLPRVALDPKTRLRTATGMITGTVSYMSPEQVRGNALDARTDIWSWGIVLYEVLAHRLPFPGDNAGEVISNVLELQPKPPSSSKPLNRIVVRSLEKDLERRYQTMDEPMNQLLRIQKEEGAILDLIRPAPIDERKEPKIRLQYLAWILLSLVVTASAAFVWHWYSMKVYEVLSVRRITRRGDVTAVALSRDGNHLAYSAEEQGTGSLHLIEPETAIDIERVSRYDGQIIGIAFSPDGSYVYYVVMKDGNGTLYKVPYVGGEPKMVLEDIDSPIAFSPNGKRFAFERFEPAKRVGLILVGDDQERSVVATVPFPIILSRTLDWSPEGTKIVFEAYDNSIVGPQQLKIGAAAVDQSRIEYGKPPGWAWMGSHVVLSSERLLLSGKASGAEPDHLYELDWRSGEARALTHETAQYDSLSATPDHKSIAAVQSVNESSLWLLEKGKVDRLTPSNGHLSGVSWIRNQLLVGGEINGHSKLSKVDKESHRMYPLTDGPGFDMFPSAAPAGGRIVFASDRDGRYHIWSTSEDGSNARRLTQGSSLELDPSMSFDGSMVFFSSDRDGLMKIWRVPIEGGEPLKVTDRPSRHPELSPDGRWIVCAYGEGGVGGWGIVVLDAKNGGVKYRFPKIPASPPDETDQRMLVRWSHKSRGLLYVVTEQGVSNIWEQGLNGGSPHQKTQFTEGRILDFAPSFDGKSIAYIRGTDGGDVALIQGAYQ
jgi:eukaryotic-like serine/threonine-protein kinase